MALGLCVSHAATAAASISGVSPQLDPDKVPNGSVFLLKVKLPSELASLPEESLAVEFADRKFPLFKPAGSDEFEALVGVPLEHGVGPSKAKILVTQGDQRSEHEIEVQVVDGKYEVQRLTVAPKYVEPPKRFHKRIQEENHLIGELYSRVTRKKYWEGPLRLPIESPITGSFGARRVFNNTLKNPHGGTDLKAAIGTPIHSSASGVVIMARNLYYTGNTIIVDHGYGVLTLYAHLSKMKVKEGDEIKGQQVLGLSGKTGRVSGPHLHWQVIVGHVKVNPMDAIKVVR